MREDLGCAGGVWTGVPGHSQPPAHTSGGRRGPEDVFVPVTKTRVGVAQSVRAEWQSGVASVTLGEGASPTSSQVEI